MIAAVDTNVIVALRDLDPKWNVAAQTALDGAVAKGGLVISAPVFRNCSLFHLRQRVLSKHLLRPQV